MTTAHPPAAVLAALAAWLAQGAMAGEVNDYRQGTASQRWVVEQRSSIRSHLWVPPNIQPGTAYRLAIFLHGAGDRGPDPNEAPMHHWQQLPTDVDRWLSPAVQDAYPTFVYMPQCPSPYAAIPGYSDATATPAQRLQYQWVGAWWGARPDPSYSVATTPISAPMADATIKLNEILAAYPAIDRTRISVSGGSMGGFGCFDMVMRNPTLFAAAVPMAGAGDPAMAAAVVAGRTPIWAIHGREDGIIADTGSSTIMAALRTAGATADQARLFLLGTPGLDDSPGHIWQDAEGWTPGVTAWMLTQRRGSASLAGDANGDGTVNQPDVTIVAAQYGRTSADSGFDVRADLDRDGRVGPMDLGLVTANHGRSQP